MRLLVAFLEHMNTPSMAEVFVQLLGADKRAPCGVYWVPCVREEADSLTSAGLCRLTERC